MKKHQKELEAERLKAVSILIIVEVKNEAAPALFKAWYCSCFNPNYRGSKK